MKKVTIALIINLVDYIKQQLAKKKNGSRFSTAKISRDGISRSKALRSMSITKTHSGLRTEC